MLGGAGADGGEEWLAHVPEHCTVVAVARGPLGRGLLAARWRRGAPPLLACVGGGATALPLLHELDEIMRASRAANQASTAPPLPPSTAAAAEPGAAAAEARPQPQPVAPVSAEGTGVSAEGGGAVVRAVLVASAPHASLTLDAARPEAVLGRERAAPFRLDHPEASGAHCTLRFDAADGVLTLTDTSTNGTFVDGVRPTSRQKRTVTLRHGAVVSFVGKSGSAAKRAAAAKQLPSFRVQLLTTPAVAPPAAPPPR